MTSEPDHLQELCEQGQEALVGTDYLKAESLLVQADALATTLGDFDTLSRLYMPLQEARRQRRQRCGEGTVDLNILPFDRDTHLDVDSLITFQRQGQFLIADWGTLEPARAFRAHCQRLDLFAETFLAAAYALEGDARAVIISPFSDVQMPAANQNWTLVTLHAAAPPDCVVMESASIPEFERQGTWKTYAEVMAIWELLHRPFLARADAAGDPFEKITLYRKTIDVDYACELAHQNLSAAAAKIAKERAVARR